MATLGNTTIGESADSGGTALRAWVGPLLATENGTINSIKYYAMNSGVNAIAGLYEDSGGSPGALVAQSTEIALDTDFAWKEFSLSGTITSGKSYWLAIITNGTATFFYDAGTNDIPYLVMSYGTLPDPFGTPSGSGHNQIVSMYLDYTPGATITGSPVSTWAIVPHQRINAGETLNAGVLAFSKGGVDHVALKVDGGTATNVSSMSANSQLLMYNGAAVRDYHVAIDADDLEDGQHTLDATAVPTSGSATNTVLTQIDFYSNADGTRSDLRAWVSTTGNNATGKVCGTGGDTADPSVAQASPFLTPRAAAKALDAAGELSGAILYVEPGTYSNHGANWDETNCSAEWFEVVGLGDTPDDTVFHGDGILIGTRIKLTNIRLEADAVTGGAVQGSNSVASEIWLHNCHEVGEGEEVSTNPVMPQNGALKIYRTQWEIEECARPALSGYYYIGGYGHNCYNDVFQNFNLCWGNRTSDLSTSYPDDVHLDHFQFWGTAIGGYDYTIYGSPLIGMNYFGTLPDQPNNHLQQMTDFGESDSIQGIAIIGNWFDAPVAGQGFGPCNNVLIWDNTYAGGGEFPSAHLSVYPFLSVKGNIFDSGAQTTDLSDESAFDYNHFTSGSTLGTHTTTGTASLTNGVPASNSAVAAKLAPFYPIDLAGRARYATSALGAYESPALVITASHGAITDNGDGTFTVAMTSTADGGSGTTTIEWTGDGATFSASTSADANATFDAAGTYTVRVTYTDTVTEEVAYDDVTVRVGARNSAAAALIVMGIIG